MSEAAGLRELTYQQFSEKPRPTLRVFLGSLICVWRAKALDHSQQLSELTGLQRCSLREFRIRRLRTAYCSGSV